MTTVKAGSWGICGTEPYFLYEASNEVKSVEKKPTISKIAVVITAIVGVLFGTTNRIP